MLQLPDIVGHPVKYAELLGLHGHLQHIEELDRCLTDPEGLARVLLGDQLMRVAGYVIHPLEGTLDIKLIDPSWIHRTLTPEQLSGYYRSIHEDPRDPNRLPN